ncbi:hypothetical protein D3C81_2028000 [compost metagenome]
MPRKTLAATARAEAPPRPMVRWNRKPKPRVIHLRIFQCHSRADRAEITRISGSTLKAKVNSALSFCTG